jgi:AcrR family transcriptional regulator
VENIQQKVDGRHERLERSKLAVLQAVNDIVRETGKAPTADTLAKRSGVSRRSIFRLFGSKAGLLRAAAEFTYGQIRERFPIPDFSAAEAPERVSKFVEHLSSIYEYITPFRRVSERSPQNEGLIERERGRIEGLYENQLRQAFAELGGAGWQPSSILRDTIQALVSWNTWNYLRNEQHHAIEYARTILTQAILALLQQHGMLEK